MSNTEIEIAENVTPDQVFTPEQLIQYIRDHLEPHHIWSLKELQQAVRDLKEELI